MSKWVTAPFHQQEAMEKNTNKNVETRKQTLPLGYPVPNGKSLAIVCVESK